MQITLDESLEIISKLQTKFNNSDDPINRYTYVTAIEKELEDILNSMKNIRTEYHESFINFVIDNER